ncbi:MAG: N-6 DNA methylase [Bradymonadia bacterium]
MSKLTRKQLFDHLWAAADHLRGAIDSSDYKNYIFGFLFLKRMSDRFEEEALELIKQGEDEDDAWNDPDYHSFYVPERARWSEIRKLTTGIGDALNKACIALEEENSTLEGVLRGINFNDSQKLGDAKQIDSLLHALIAHFSEINLANANLSEPDMLGRAYEFLIERFADDAGKKGGEFYTPNMVVRLLVELLDPQEGQRICDPTCGSGGMLIQSAQYVAEQTGKRLGRDAINLTLHGQEKNLGTWGICKLNLLLHGILDTRIEKGDTIRDPKLLHEGELLMYHRVITNPPFSLDKWGAEAAKKDGFKRFERGVPPKNTGDYAFVQHMIATLNDGGVAGIVMPHGVLFRGSGDGRVREALIREDLFEAIIGLPENLFFGTGIPAVILIFNRSKPEDRKGKVLFVHAAESFESQTNQNVLRVQDIERIVAAYRSWSDEDRFSRVVEFDEIEENDFNLNVARYIDTLEPEESVDLASAMSRLQQAEARRDEAAQQMNHLLAELGYVH